MSRADRRKAGVTMFKVLRAARQLSKDPDFEPGSEEEFAEAVLTKLVPPEGRQGLDLAALLEFIMAILAMFMKL